MFWKVFLAELKAAFSNKRMIIKWVAIILIPFIYAFTYLYAFWNPYQYLTNLKLTIVNNDSDAKQFNNLNIGAALENKITSENIDIQGYKLHFTSQKPHSDIHDLLNDYYGIIEIPSDYSQKTATIIKDMVISHKANSFISLPQINFYNTYKRNFLIGEITSFSSSMSPVYVAGIEAVIDSLHQSVNYYINHGNFINSKLIIDFSNSLFTKFQDSLNVLKNHPLFHLESQAPQLNSYGFGLAPYFICIGLWVGQLVQHFLVTKKRKIKNAKLLPNFFGKSLFLMMNATVQAIILLIGLSCIGLRLSGFNEIGLIAFVIVLGWFFTVFIQALIFIFKKPDIGRFLIIILLVLQLSSSSGTFPAELQPKIFLWLHQIIPFTYTIAIIREIFFQPNLLKIFIYLIILIGYLVIAISGSLYLNKRAENKILLLKNEEANNSEIT